MSKEHDEELDQAIAEEEALEEEEVEDEVETCILCGELLIDCTCPESIDEEEDKTDE
jgi:hypothetical protein